MSFLNQRSAGGGRGGFKACSFSFTAVDDSTSDTEPASSSAHVTASGSNAPSVSSVAPFTFTSEPGAFSFSPPGSTTPVASSVTPVTFTHHASSFSFSTTSPMAKADESDAAAFTSDVDPCPPWKAAMEANPHYPIPMMGECQGQTGGGDHCKASFGQQEWPLQRTEQSLRYVPDKPALQYLACEVEKAMACLRKMTKLEVMKALRFEADYSNNYASTMVHVAAYRCDLATLKALVELTGPAVLLVQDGRGCSPLMEAFFSPVQDTSATIEYLLDHYPPELFFQTDFSGRTLLSLAVRSNRLAHVQAVVGRHPPTDWKYLPSSALSVDYNTVHLATHVTALPMSVEILLFLYEALPTEAFYGRNSNGESLVHSLCLSNFTSYKALYALAGQELLKQESFSGKTVLHAAAEAGRTDVLQFLLAEMEEEDICKKCSVRGALALHYAARNRHFLSYHMLLASSPPEARLEQDFTGASALDVAAHARFDGYRMTNLDEECADIRAGTVRELQLRGYLLCDYDAHALADALQLNDSLAVLDLEENQIEDDGADALAEALLLNRSITTVNLAENCFGDYGARALACALRESESIATLNLKGQTTRIGKEGAWALGAALRCNTSLKALNLGDNAIGIDGIHPLAEGLLWNTSLTTLGLNANNINAKGAETLAEALQRNSSLSELDLRHNTITSSGCEALAKALVCNDTLEILRLGYNGLGDTGARALAEALQQNCRLTDLDLTMNYLSAYGAGVLVTALQKSCCLSTLILSGNKIGNEGTLAISQLLETNSSLNTLLLRRCDIGGDGVWALAKALQHNDSLGRLDLSANHRLGKEGAALATLVQHNRGLLSLDLNDNDVTEECAIAVLEALQYNDCLVALTLGESYPLWN